MKFIFLKKQQNADTANKIYDSSYAVVTCEIKLFLKYFRGLLQLMDIFQHVQCRWNNFEIVS